MKSKYYEDVITAKKIAHKELGYAKNYLSPKGFIKDILNEGREQGYNSISFKFATIITVFCGTISVWEDNSIREFAIPRTWIIINYIKHYKNILNKNKPFIGYCTIYNSQDNTESCDTIRFY